MIKVVNPFCRVSEDNPLINKMSFPHLYQVMLVMMAMVFGGAYAIYFIITKVSTILTALQLTISQTVTVLGVVEHCICTSDGWSDGWARGAH